MFGSYLIALLIVCSIAFPVMFVMSSTPELRPGRWPKIFMSLPFLAIWTYTLGSVVVGVFDGIAVALLFGSSTGMLAIIWCGNISWYISGIIPAILDGGGRADGTVRPDYTIARVHIDKDEIPEAITAIRIELRKSPHEFEGLRLLAAALKETDELDRALESVELIYANPDITEAQREIADAAKDELQQLIAIRKIQEG